MDWQDHLWIVVPILIINTLIALVILIYGILNPKGRRCEFVTFSVLVLFCPVAMPIFLAATRLIEMPSKRKEVDMSDISFNKQREDIDAIPDYSTELNYVSLQDAMRLSSVSELRRLLINVMKYNPQMSLTSVAEAMNSPDTETSHFAASAIQDALSEFRATAQKLITEMQAYPEDVEINLMALEYIFHGLMLRIMTPIEHQSYVYTENTVAQNLFDHNVWFMTAEHYLWMTVLMIDIQDYEKAALWVNRAMTCRPDELDTYKARLRLHYARQNRSAFLDCISDFRASTIKADQEMLDLLRLYQ